MEKTNGLSIKSALTIIVFVSFIAGLYLSSLNNLTVPLMWILLPAGILSTLVCCTFVGWKLFYPNTNRLIPRLVLSSLLLILTVSAIGAPGVMLTIFLILIPTGLPIFILFSQAIACSSLIRSGVSKQCRFALITSIILALGTWPTASVLGTDKYPNAVEIPLYAVIFGWISFSIAASLFAERTQQARVESTPGSPAEDLRDRKGALILWTLGTMTWIVLLIYIWGIAVKES